MSGPSQDVPNTVEVPRSNEDCEGQIEAKEDMKLIYLNLREFYLVT